MTVPSGKLLGMEPEWLQGSPFHSYFLPGLLLFLFNGLLPLTAVAGLVTNSRIKWPGMLNLYPNRQWAWAWSVYSGIVAITWITLQLVMTSYFWIQPIIIFTGLLILVTALVPSTMKYYEK